MSFLKKPNPNRTLPVDVVVGVSVDERIVDDVNVEDGPGEGDGVVLHQDLAELVAPAAVGVATYPLQVEGTDLEIVNNVPWGP